MTYLILLEVVGDEGVVARDGGGTDVEEEGEVGGDEGVVARDRGGTDGEEVVEGEGGDEEFGLVEGQKTGGEKCRIEG